MNDLAGCLPKKDTNKVIIEKAIGLKKENINSLFVGYLQKCFQFIPSQKGP